MKKIRSYLLLALAFAGLNAFAISAPSITSCTRPSSTSVKLSWTSVSGVSYYVVRRSFTSSVGSAQSLGTTTSTTYTDSQAGADTCYYWVEAWDSSGASARSGMATASSGSGGSSSGGFSINASDGTSASEVVITWTAQSGATGYRVVRGNSSNMDYADILAETVTGTSYTDTTATAGKTYYYWVVAKKSSGYVISSYNTGYCGTSASGGSGSGSSSGSSSTSYDGNPYTVKFNANGGTGTMANESFVYGTAKALTINAFTRAGYTFIGWSKSSSATSSTYDDGQTVNNLTTTSGGTVNLYAVWQANSYTIKFNKNGGSGSMANLAMTYGTAKALTANAFQRVNYKFVGWSTSSSATSATYTNKQSVNNLTTTVDGVVNLYAVWKLVLEVTSVTARQRYPWNGLVDIDVTFSAGGLSKVFFEVKDMAGNTNLNAQTIYVGNPEQNNRTLEVQPGTHRFVWNAAADLGTVQIPSFAVTATVREKTFQVNVTGGTGSGSFVQGKSATLSAAAKTGYTFTSWSGTTADVGLLASATSSSTTLTIPSRDVAYEATYTPNTYTVKFNANGGSGTMAYESFTYDVSKALTVNAFTRPGFTFKGWADSASATTAKYTNGQSVKNLATSGTKNLYAVWDPQGVQLWANGPYWAKNNLGATKPEGTGYYFRWGDTVGYIRVGSSWNSSDGTVTGFSFSSAVSSFEDAATAQLGAPWRVPTSAEIAELWSNTSWSETKYNGVRGIEFKGKGDYSGKSIFIPIVGYVSGTSLTYWYDYSYNTNSLETPNGGTKKTRIMWSSSSKALFCYVTDKWTDTSDPLDRYDTSGYWSFNTIGTNSGPKYYGLQIRPIMSAD